jgi:hypothetical protein
MLHDFRMRRPAAASPSRAQEPVSAHGHVSPRCSVSRNVPDGSPTLVNVP